MIFTDEPNELQQSLNQESLLHRMIKRSLDLQEILTTAVYELRSFLNTDRVKLYKFNPDGTGIVVAESIHEQQLPSLLGLHFPADDIPPAAREMFLLAQQRSIVDVIGGKIGLSPLKSPETGESIPENIYYRQLDPCHIQYLQAMGVQSSLVVPILTYDLMEEGSAAKLWGLLVSHHSQPRVILNAELQLVQQIADQLAIAISQNNLLQKTRTQQRRESIINRISTLMHPLPTTQMQAAVEETIAAFNGIGGRLYIESSQELYTWGEQPQTTHESENQIIEKNRVWKQWLASKPGQIQAISDLHQEQFWQILAKDFKSPSIRGMMVIPFYYREVFLGVFSIFRPEFDTEILWAGKREQNQYQELPKFSFELWRETKKGQAPEWKPEDISLATGLCHHFLIALQQQQTYQQLHILNNQLEQRIKEKTAKLETSLSLTKALKQVTDQTRSTLDLNIILQTIVREVRLLLNSDRVLICRFLHELNSHIIFEDINSSNCSSVLGIQLPSTCFPEESVNLYLQGRIRTINNVSTDQLTPCHRNFLESLQVQANLIVPVKIDTQLWGLLIAQQCTGPRIWQTKEIELLQQLADQATVAIQQAQLYEQSRVSEAKSLAKATELEQTLNRLQETQAKLIHSEKMSSLGQLVAGIAHEINNPVNFIYGNLGHANDYSEQILKIIKLYQSHYPQPDPEISAALESIDFDFVVEDLPKIMSSMQVGTSRIRSIVLSLRNFSRLDEAENKSVDLHEGIDNTLLILQHRLKPDGSFPGIEIIKDYGELPKIECYAGQMNQVFMNVISNAIDVLTDESLKDSTYSPTIRISSQVSEENTHILVSIADNGPGINQEVKQRIFDPFFTTKPVGKGTGLGLAISHQIVVEKHGGLMECVSEPGKGTEFWIEIPMKFSTEEKHS